MDEALADLQSLQNDMMARWTGIPEIGNYILKPDDASIEAWMEKFENVRQAMLASAPAAKKG